MSTCTHSFPLVKPKTAPVARDYKGPWCPMCEKRCYDCGTARGHVWFSSHWGDWVCNLCAGSRLACF